MLAGRCRGQLDTRLGSSEPSVAPLPRILLEQWPYPCPPGPAGDHSTGGRSTRTARDFLPSSPPPAARHPTPGSPRGYLTPSLSSSFLRAGGRSAASHIPKETVGSFEKVGLALGCLFIASRAPRSHASVPQRSCTGLFIFPLLCFPLGRPSQECRWYCRHGEVEEDSGRASRGTRAHRLALAWVPLPPAGVLGMAVPGGRLGVCHCSLMWAWGGLGSPPSSWLFVEVGGCGAWRLSRWEPARLPALAGPAASSGALLWPCQVAQRTGWRLGPLPAVGWGMRGLRVCTRNTGTLRQRCSLPADAPHPLIPHWASASSVMAAGASPPPHAVTGAPHGEKPRAPHPLSAPRFGAAQRGVAGRRAARKHRALLQGGSEEGGF